jgi:mono/diheme cytochrome c family protein
MSAEIFQRIGRKHFAALLISITATAAAADTNSVSLPAPAIGQVLFDRDVRPVFEQSCFRCHGPEKPKSDFRLDLRAEALRGGDDNTNDVVPGHSDRSKLVAYVAGLDEKIQMPPPDRGQPLTPGQVAVLRAWIDQGAEWGTNRQPELAFTFEPELRWIGVDGDTKKFRELEGVHEGVGGGAEQFSLTDQITPDEKLTLEGHALVPENDFKLTMALEKNNVGFVRGGFEEWRKYFDDNGGFAPSLPTNSFRLGRDLHLDIGRAWFDLGLMLPDWPQVVLGYEYQFREGDESTLQWGPVGTKPPSIPGTDAKNIFPASEHVDENTHILKLDLNYDAAGWRLEESARVEFYTLATSRRNVLADSFASTPNTVASIAERQQQIQGADTFSISKPITDWLSVSSGYFYSRLDGDAAYQQSTLNGSGMLIGGDQWVADGITLKRESQVASFGSLIGPWAGLTLSSGVQGEWTRQEGAGLENVLLPVAPGIPPAPPTNMIVGNLDSASARENVSLRYARIPYSVLFAEAHLQQESLNQFDLGEDRGAEFTRAGDADIESAEYRAGFNASPWQRLSLGASFKHSLKSTDYGNIKKVNTLPDYPGFIEWRDIEHDQIEARLVYRASSWMRTSFNYRIEETDFNSATTPIMVLSPGGAIEAANQKAHVYSVNAVLTPFSRLFLSSTLSYSDSRTATTLDGSNGLVPYQGNVYSLITSGTFALNQKTDLNANYAFSKSDYGQNNQATGLPAGINYERHDLRVGITRRFAKGLAMNLAYGFSQYREPTSGGADNFTAHSVFATLTIPWP